MKAYKVFNKNMTCRGFKYEVGKTYTHDGEIKLCVSGFHACLKAVDCFNYYSFDPENRVCEVELLGEIVGLDQDKQVTNKIKILRELSWNEVLSIVNVGDSNTGYSNTGNSNTGNSNTGDWNTGNWNTGNRNTGNRNTGYRNSGDLNTGDLNTGDLNTGDLNTGNWNSSDRSSGFFNTETSINVFNKPCSIDEWNNSYKPRFLYFDLEEGKTYKECFKKSWDHADEQDRIRVKDLPNFDADIFFEISGIDLR